MKKNIYRYFFPALLVPVFSHAAEFWYQGKAVTSEVTKITTVCSNFMVDVLLDRFPREFEYEEGNRKIPEGLTVPHNGSILYVSAEVVVTINNKRYKLPQIKTLLQYKPELIKYFPRYNGKANYLPLSAAECTNNGFSLNYWIGGNGVGADNTFNYKVKGYEISIPEVLSFDELSDLVETI